MDPQGKPEMSIDQILEEPGFAHRLLFDVRSLSDRFSEKSYLDFNIDQSLDISIKVEQFPLPLPLEPDECHSIREEVNDDTNHFEDIDSVEEPEKPEEPDIGQLVGSEKHQKNCIKQSKFEGEQFLGVYSCPQKMEQIIQYLVQNTGKDKKDFQERFASRFPGSLENETVLDLFEKFTKLKKTKEELVKYCMRKAFKFILELPKNEHLLAINKEEKFSFAKCKSRFLKKISEEKSMNNKFLGQIFQEGDFSEDYLLFLEHFDKIMQEDNQKKVKYLAQLLTVSREGRVKSVEMVRRLPWTRTILNKVVKISRELLKYSGPK